MKISIITTNYNTDKYLEDTIKNILNQKGDFELEYIITDGGSTDKSLGIIKKYKDRIKYISEKDKGQSNGINKGLKMATGDIVAFLNADDLYTGGALEKVVKHFKKNPECKWITGYCRIMNAESKEIRRHITRYKNFKLRNYSFQKLLIEDFISQPSTFWRRELLEELGYLDESLHYAMDYEYWCRIAQKYEPCLIKEYLSEFRFTNNTKTGSSIEKTLSESLLIAGKYTENRSVLFKHKIHSKKRKLAYNILKFFSK